MHSSFLKFSYLLGKRLALILNLKNRTILTGPVITSSLSSTRLQNYIDLLIEAYIPEPQYYELWFMFNACNHVTKISSVKPHKTCTTKRLRMHNLLFKM